MIEKEIWKDIPGYEGYYEVSNLGRVKSVERIIINKQRPKKCKAQIMKSFIVHVYLSVGLRKGEKRMKLVHRLVAQAFIPNPENKATVNHINGDKFDNNVKNLEWATQKENSHHAWKTGLMHPAIGAKNAITKISDDNVRKIRTLYNEGMKMKEISKLLSFTYGSIRGILKANTRKHVI